MHRKSQLQGEPYCKTGHCRPETVNRHEEIIWSATQLNEAGIRFKKSKTNSLKDISFSRGVLRLPSIIVDDTTESMFLNLIAFERFHVGAGNEVTSYIFFMDNIIDNARDVALLHSKGIIHNALGSDKAVADLFNSLSKDITLDPDSSLDAVHKKVYHYCKKPWNVWRANLMHTYFRNPWAIISLIAGVFLFVLTIVQTGYSIYPYYFPNDGSPTCPCYVNNSTSPAPPPPPPPNAAYSTSPSRFIIYCLMSVVWMLTGWRWFWSFPTIICGFWEVSFIILLICLNDFFLFAPCPRNTRFIYFLSINNSSMRENACCKMTILEIVLYNDWFHKSTDTYIIPRF